MALTAYRTWVTGEVVTAAQMNEQIKDNGNALLPTCWDVVIDGGGAVIVADTFIDVIIGMKCDIVAVGAYGADTDVTYELEVDILKILASDFATPPDSDDSICAAALVTIGTDVTFSYDATLTSWTKAIAEYSLLRYYVTACTGMTKATIVTHVVRS